MLESGSNFGHEPLVIIEVGPSLGSSSKFEPDSRLKVNKTKARARSSLIFQSSIELFKPKYG